MSRLWLIARREIVAYTGVASFWVALALGPVLMVATALLTSTMTPRPAPPPAVRVAAPDAELAAAVTRALKASGLRAVPADAAKDGPLIRISLDASQTRAQAEIRGAVSASASAILDRELRLALQRRQMAGAPADVQARIDAVEIAVVRPARAAPHPILPPERIARFGVTMLLWLTLVGALGMLLQAIVRERTQRALESLMSSARPVEIVAGKLLGVGVVSIVVLGAWLITGAAVAPIAGGSGGQIAAALLSAAFGDLSRIAFVLVVYLLAFAMYGSGLLAVGALARDVASAQNLSRPVFGVLLLVFFAALTQLGGSAGLSPALLWVPPVTPFALLLAEPGSLRPAEAIGGVAIMVAGTALGLTLASRLLVAQLDGAPSRRVRNNPRPAAA
jgi:ABC-2 type transport system permease protein